MATIYYLIKFKNHSHKITFRGLDFNKSFPHDNIARPQDNKLLPQYNILRPQ